MAKTNQQLREDLVRTLVEEHEMDVELAEAKAAKVTILSEADGQVSSIGLWVGGPVPRGSDPVTWLAGEIARQTQKPQSKEAEEPPKNEYDVARKRVEDEQKAKSENRMNLRKIAGRA